MPLLKRQRKLKRIVQSTVVYANPVRNGGLAMFDDWPLFWIGLSKGPLVCA